jgi:hypothetical protein
VFKPEILTLEETGVVLRQAFTVKVFKPEILTLEGTVVVLRQAFTVKVFVCLNQKY